MKKHRIKGNTVVGVIIMGMEFLATDKCRKKYNSGNPITVIKYNLN